MDKLIAIVDDEADIRELISINLKKYGYKTKEFGEAKALFKYLDNNILPELLILDLMLPDMDGLEICKRLRQKPKTKNLPIIMLTAKAEETDKIIGLELGADDYMTKPFSPKELAVRIKALLRRTVINDSEPAKLNISKQVYLDSERYELFVDNKKIETTTTEFKILQILASRKGVVFSREKILDHLWGNDKAVIDRTVDVHVKHLREKLGKHAELIKNVRGVGYKLDEDYAEKNNI